MSSSPDPTPSSGYTIAGVRRADDTLTQPREQDATAERVLAGQFRRVPAEDDLRSGDWTRLGSAGVVGDPVTERLLADLAEKARHAGHAQGYAAGWSQGRAEAAAEAAETARTVAAQHAQARAAEAAAAARQRDLLTAAAAQVAAQAATVAEEVNSAAVELAFELVEIILGRELASAADADRAADALTRVLALAGGEPLVALRMHPADLGHVDVTALQDAGTRVVPDPAMAPGDAVAETDAGILDATTGAAIARLREAWSA